VQAKVARSIDRSSFEVFLRGDFKRIGSYTQIGKALNALMRAGQLVRLGYGVYAKARPSSLSGRPVPRKPLESLALQTFKKLGIKVDLGFAAREYNAGSTQVPPFVCYDTGARRISRKLRVGLEEVQYENDYNRPG
jgi:hypothetical protein